MRQISRISRKLPLVIVGSAMAVGIGIGAASYMTTSSSKTEMAEAHIATSAESARDEFVTYLQTIERDLRSVATNPLTAQAISGLSRAWNVIDNPTGVLQAAYIDDNPNPMGEKHLLDRAESGQIYDSVHANFHPWFRRLQQNNGYYDVFLFDTEGNLIYSVFKERDYATNFATPDAGEWASTDLGEVYRAAMAAPADEPVVFEDFEPYGPSADAPASFIAHPVFDNYGLKIGVLAYQMPIDAINAVFAEAEGLGASGEIALIGQDGLLRNDSVRTADVNDILTTQLDAEFIDQAFTQGRSWGNAEFYRGTELKAHAVSFEFIGTPYAVVAMKSVEEMMQPVYAIRNRMALIGGILLAIVAAVGIVLSRSMTRPINTLVNEMRQLSDGNTAVEIAGTGRADEIGDMSRAVMVFRDAMLERERLEGETANAATERDARQQQIDTLIHQFHENVEAVVHVVSANADTMTSAANALTQIAMNTDEEAASAAASSEEASTNVQTVAAAAEELSASITEIGRQVEKTTQVVDDATQHARTTDSQIEQLAETAGKIGNVISLIQEIAEQTNLLALNATIEAARAGEAGKGFAVVASEVKGLANQTAKATGEIATQISEIQSSTQDAVTAIHHITATMGEVNEYMSAIAASVEEQGAATDEISHNVTQAAQGTQSVVGNITGVTKGTTQTTEYANDVNNAASSVTENTQRLNDTVSAFLRAVAAA